MLRIRLKIYAGPVYHVKLHYSFEAPNRLVLRRQERNEIVIRKELESKAKFSSMKTLQIEQAVKQTNAA